MLLHQGAPPKLMDAVPPMLPPHTVAVALATIRLLRSVAELDLQMFQVRNFFFVNGNYIYFKVKHFDN